MTIHSGHPFDPPPDQRDPLRRLRGRLAAPVTVWTTGEGTSRRGLTVSSVLVADGEPAHVIALVDPDADLAEALALDDSARVVVNVLGAAHRFLADAFAGVAPAPGGPFTLGTWTDSPWGPTLDGSAGWVGLTFEPSARRVGHRLLVDGLVQHVEVGDVDPLVHLRGRYRTDLG